jgi:hypothetical protein
MENTTLDQVQRLVDHLSPLDQVRLLAYLTPRIAQNVTSMYLSSSTPTSNHTVAWKEFFHIGDMLAASDKPETQTLTTAVLMRR